MFLPSLLFAAAVQAASVPTSIDETSEVEYLDIEGRTAQDIADWFSARQFGGVTSSSSTNLSTYFGFEYRDGQCVLTGITASLHHGHVRPRWVDEADGPRRVRQQWNTYLDNLETHEEGHREIARRGAAIVVERLSQVPPAPDCDALGDTLDALRRDLWDRLQVSQREYDQATQRGRTQGAYIEFRSRR